METRLNRVETARRKAKGNTETWDVRIQLLFMWQADRSNKVLKSKFSLMLPRYECGMTYNLGWPAFCPMQGTQTRFAVSPASHTSHKSQNIGSDWPPNKWRRRIGPDSSTHLSSFRLLLVIHASWLQRLTGQSVCRWPPS
jgi:hypothetical protein